MEIGLTERKAKKRGGFSIMCRREKRRDRIDGKENR